MQAVAVDFDGVIHRYSKGWQDGSIYDGLVPGAVEGIIALSERFAVFILTSRDIEQVVPWMQNNTVLDVAADGPPWPKFWISQEQILVTNRKLPAFAYLDDRAVRFVGWDFVPHQIIAYRSGS